jgi:hypothetical protein
MKTKTTTILCLNLTRMMMDSEGAVLRDKALDMLEEKRHEWIALARKMAVVLLKTRGQDHSDDYIPTVTSDDLWALCPPPPEINPKAMGAVFRSGFKPVGYVPSKRKQAHARPIRVWTLA